MFKKGTSGNPNGRPKGTNTVPRFGDYVSEDERKKFVEFVLDNYMGDMRLAIWMGDNLFKKPKAEVDVTSDDEPLTSNIDEAALAAAAAVYAEAVKKRKIG